MSTSGGPVGDPRWEPHYDGTVGPGNQEIVLSTPYDGEYLYIDATNPDDTLWVSWHQPSDFQNLGDEMEDTTVLWLGIIDTEWNDVLDYIAIDVDHEFMKTPTFTARIIQEESSVSWTIFLRC